MHLDKTLARILLILSVVHVVVAAPVIVRQRSLGVDEDVTPASEKRGNPGDMPQDLSSVPQMDNEPPTTSGTPPPHNDQPQASGPPSSQDDTSPASGDPESHSGPPAGSEDPQLHDAPFQSPPASGTPQLDNDRPSALGTPQLHDDPLTASGTSSVHDDLPLGPEAFDESYRFNDYSLHTLVARVGGALVARHPRRKWARTGGHPFTSRGAPTNNFISYEGSKLKRLAGYGVVIGVFCFLYGVIKLSLGKSYVSAFFHPSPADI
jgi:hypothetical protein